MTPPALRVDAAGARLRLLHVAAHPHAASRNGGGPPPPPASCQPPPLTPPAPRVGAAGERLRLLHVHAHPDDESSKGAATTARYVAEGVQGMVATCTGGGGGATLTPARD